MEVEPKRRKISLSGLEHTLYAWDQGSDTTILFLHGFLDVGQGFSFIVEALKDSTWNFLALDWRGHAGLHGLVRWILSLHDYVRDLVRPKTQCFKSLRGWSFYGCDGIDALVGRNAVPCEGRDTLGSTGPIPLSSEAAQSRVGQWLSDVNLI